MNAKKRLVKYLNIKGVTQYDFSRRTGLSNGYLNSGDNITSANLDIITNVFRDLNLIWLVKGFEPMLIPESKKPLTYDGDDAGNGINLLNEDYLSWMAGDGDEKLLNMTPEQLINLNKALKMVIKTKDETIQAKDDRIVTLEKLLDAKDNLNEIKDQLIIELRQNQSKG